MVGKDSTVISDYRITGLRYKLFDYIKGTIARTPSKFRHKITRAGCPVCQEYNCYEFLVLLTKYSHSYVELLTL